MDTPDAGLRRLTLFVGAAVLLDTTFLAVVAPLLPGLSHQLHLSKFGAGLLTGAYPAGMLVASIPGAMLSIRRGARFAVCAGLALFTASTVAFALVRSAPALDLARFVQGVGGACSWAGGLAWLIAAVAPARRGAVIGQAMSAAIAGAVAGPAVGAVASATGRAALFLVLAGAGLLLTLLIARLRVSDTAVPAAGTLPGRRLVPALGAMARRPMGPMALWSMALPAALSAALDVLGPLRLHPLGAGAGVIGATFLAAALLETTVSGRTGRLSDRHGRTIPLVAALVLAGVAMVCFSLPSSVAPLIVVIILADTGLGLSLTPAMALVSDLSDAVGLDQALGAGLMNVFWAGGQLVGSAGGGGLARLAGDGAVTVALGILCLLTAGWLARHRHAEAGLRAAPGQPASPRV